MGRIKQRIAMVTGGGLGIGRDVALRLAQDDCAVAIFDRNVDAAQAVVDEIGSLGHRAIAIPGDVSQRADVDRAVAICVDEFGPVDILVNNAGILRTTAFLDVSEADWRGIFAVNLDGTFHFSQAVLPDMVARKSGCIVNMSSWTGKKGVPNHAAYAATKAAIINLTQSLAGEFGQHGIRINAVCPGIIVDTAMREEAEALNREQGLPDVATRTAAVPLQRPGYPGEIAELVVFLASEKAGYMTGQAINITGGLWMN